MVVHFNRLKLCPANVRSPSDSSQNTSYRQDGDVGINIGNPSLRRRGIAGSFVPDVVEYDEVDNLVISADGVE